VVSNRKAERRRGKVQLIDASGWYHPLRKNLGKKNCELWDEDIKRILQTFLSFEETEHSKIFANETFGFWKITLERPLRLKSQFSQRAVDGLRFNSGDEEIRRELYAQFGQSLYEQWSNIKAEIEQLLTGDSEDEGEEEEGETARKSAIPEKRRKKLLDPDTWAKDRKLWQSAKDLWQGVGDGLFDDHNLFRKAFDEAAESLGLKLSAADRKTILKAVSWRDESAPPVIAKVYRPGKAEANPLYGRYEAMVNSRSCVVEYEPDTDLRDSEQVPLLEEGGIEAFVRREVLPYVPDAWIDETATKIGYEISFTRYFYKPQALRSLEEIKADIEALEKETEGLLEDILVTTETAA
jgi:type I restriction enzyme M protein